MFAKHTLVSGFTVDVWKRTVKYMDEWQLSKKTTTKKQKGYTQQHGC